MGVTICEVLFVPFILGIDFMLSEKALPDYDLQVLRMGVREIPLYVTNINSEVTLEANVILASISCTLGKVQTMDDKVHWRTL